MKELIILFLYKDESNKLLELVKTLKGITIININNNDNIINRFKNKGISLEEMPIFIIYYGDVIKSYKGNMDNYVLIKEKIDFMFENLV